MENVITLGKLIGLLFLFCLPLLSIFLLKTPNKRNDLACPVMGTIFLVMLDISTRQGNVSSDCQAFVVHSSTC